MQTLDSLRNSIKVRQDLPMNDRPVELLKWAEHVFEHTDDWVVLFREVFGDRGLEQQLFKTPDERDFFRCSDQFRTVGELLATLRSQDKHKSTSVEPERMITIRLPRSMHDSLKAESDSLNLSINKLCISKLLQNLDPRFTPIQQGRRRGRRHGPQGPRKKLDEGPQTVAESKSA